ncbi:MAG: hypothetical protein ALAOOOJD_01043 [bacterium]|nr:hypothetical protein [bacterium]
MTNCERFTELLSDYAENTLTSAAKRELNVHLQQCTECRSAAERVDNLRRNLHRLSPLQASPDFETILRTRIKMERRAHAAPLWDWRYTAPRRVATYSAAGALAVVCMFYLWQRFSTTGLPPASASVAVSQLQPVPNSDLSAVIPAKISYALDQVAPQLWPNLGSKKRSAEPVAPANDSSRTGAPPPRPAAVMPVSSHPMTF